MAKSRKPKFPEWPAFEPMFSKPPGFTVPPYLELLNFGEGSEAAIDLLVSIIDNHANFDREVIALLADFNWRPQLVGAVAVAMQCATPRSIKGIWKALDMGSWVSPQLAAVASLVDNEFEAHARRRLEARCPIKPDRLTGTDWLLRHVAAGPESVDSHADKAMSALVGVCQLLPRYDRWLQPLLLCDDVQLMLKRDSDYGNAGEIAKLWLQAFAIRSTTRTNAIIGLRA